MTVLGIHQVSSLDIMFWGIGMSLYSVFKKLFLDIYYIMHKICVRYIVAVDTF